MKELKDFKKEYLAKRNEDAAKYDVHINYHSLLDEEI